MRYWIAATTILAAGLLAAAASKAISMVQQLGTSASLPAPYLVAVFVECLLAAGLVTSRWRGLSAWLVMWGFLGASLATGVALLLLEAPTCRCLGSPGSSLFLGLALQGAMIALAACIRSHYIHRPST